MRHEAFSQEPPGQVSEGPVQALRHQKGYIFEGASCFRQRRVPGIEWENRLRTKWALGEYNISYWIPDPVPTTVIREFGPYPHED